jgi:hypothetical protein
MSVLRAVRAAWEASERWRSALLMIAGALLLIFSVVLSVEHGRASPQSLRAGSIGAVLFVLGVLDRRPAMGVLSAVMIGSALGLVVGFLRRLFIS